MNLEKMKNELGTFFADAGFQVTSIKLISEGQFVHATVCEPEDEYDLTIDRKDTSVVWNDFTHTTPMGRMVGGSFLQSLRELRLISGSDVVVFCLLRESSDSQKVYRKDIGTVWQVRRIGDYYEVFPNYPDAKTKVTRMTPVEFWAMFQADQPLSEMKEGYK